MAAFNALEKQFRPPLPPPLHFTPILATWQYSISYMCALACGCRVLLLSKKAS